MTFKEHLELVAAVIEKKMDDNPIDIKDRLRSIREQEPVFFTPVLDETERIIIREVSKMRLHKEHYNKDTFDVLKTCLLVFHEDYEEYEACAFIIDLTWEDVKDFDFFDPIESIELV